MCWIRGLLHALCGNFYYKSPIHTQDSEPCKGHASRRRFTTEKPKGPPPNPGVQKKNRALARGSCTFLSETCDFAGSKNDAKTDPKWRRTWPQKSPNRSPFGRPFWAPGGSKNDSKTDPQWGPKWSQKCAEQVTIWRIPWGPIFSSENRCSIILD